MEGFYPQTEKVERHCTAVKSPELQCMTKTLTLPYSKAYLEEKSYPGIFSLSEHFSRMFSRCKNAGTHQQKGTSKIFEISRWFSQVCTQCSFINNS